MVEIASLNLFKKTKFIIRRWTLDVGRSLVSFLIRLDACGQAVLKPDTYTLFHFTSMTSLPGRGHLRHPGLIGLQRQRQGRIVDYRISGIGHGAIEVADSCGFG